MSQNTSTNGRNDGFNHDFTDEDARTLVSIASSPELSLHICRWAESGVRCGTAVQGSHYPAHLRYYHGIHGVGFRSLGFLCQWEDCADASTFSKEGLMRHIQERHLFWRWHCPNCGAAFMGKAGRNAHQALCDGAITK